MGESFAMLGCDVSVEKGAQDWCSWGRTSEITPKMHAQWICLQGRAKKPSIGRDTPNQCQRDRKLIIGCLGEQRCSPKVWHREKVTTKLSKCAGAPLTILCLIGLVKSMASGPPIVED